MHVVYPGSFDPPTLGHLHIIDRASKLFDKVTVLLGVNPEKNYWLNQEVRLSLLKELCSKWDNVQVDADAGLVVIKTKQLGANAILKGVRHPTDLENERIMADINFRLGDGVETVILLSQDAFVNISSSLVKQIYKLGGDIGHFVPEIVVEAVEKKR